MEERFDIDLLDDEDPFEIDEQAAHLFKHAPYGIDDVHEVWQSDPILYPARPPADWLMGAEVAGDVLVVRRPDPTARTCASAGRSSVTPPRAPRRANREDR